MKKPVATFILIIMATAISFSAGCGDDSSGTSGTQSATCGNGEVDGLDECDGDNLDG